MSRDQRATADGRLRWDRAMHIYAKQSHDRYCNCPMCSTDGQRQCSYYRPCQTCVEAAGVTGLMEVVAHVWPEAR